MPPIRVVWRHVLGLYVEVVFYEQSLSTVIPDIHRHNFIVLYQEPIDVAITLKRFTVRPFAIKGTYAIYNNASISLAFIKPP